ncbi:MAG: hypothetical protein NC337_05200 [Roseburia sp.]|nr:hypothetical protein [Roseburia sp.]
MDCKEAQRCIRSFFADELNMGEAKSFVEHVRSCKDCMEELTIEYLLSEGVSRLENADDIDVESELEERLNRVINRKRIHTQLKAGLFLVAFVLICIFLLGGV